MAISFYPHVGKTFVVGVAPSTRTALPQTPSQRTVDLWFTATFASREDYDQAKRERVRVELWTNIPTNDGDNAWRAMAFHWEDSSDAEVEAHGNPAEDSTPARFSLIQNDKSDMPLDSMTLHLRISVPLTPGRGRDQFEYTHRLVYPSSGRIEWLGEYARNGVLVFNRKVDPRFVQGEGLLFRSHAHDCKGSVLSPSRREGWDGEEVARLSSEFDWSICAMDENSFPRVYSLNDLTLQNSIRGSLLFFVPIIHHPHSLIVIPRTFSLACTRGASLSVDAHGLISITSPGQDSSLFARTYDTNANMNIRTIADAVRDTLTSCSLQGSYQVFPLDRDGSHAVISTFQNTNSAINHTTATKMISVIPFLAVPSPPAREIRIRVSALASLLPSGTSHICLFNRTTMNARFLAMPSEEKGNLDDTATVTLLVGLQCNHLILSPVYKLGAYQASIVSPHILTAADSVSSTLHPPPTPPATPPPPVRPRNTARTSRQQSKSHSHSRSRLRQSRSPQSDASQAVVDAQQRISVLADANLIFKALAHHTSQGLKGYISYMLSFAILLLKLLLLRGLIYLSTKRLPYEGFDDWMEDGDGEEWEFVDTIDNSWRFGWRDYEPLMEEDDRLSDSTAAEDGDVIKPDPVQESTKAGPSIPLLIDVPAGDVSILLRSDTPSPPELIVNCIRIELDGKRVVNSDGRVQVLGEGICSVEFSTGVGHEGRVSILPL